MLHPHKQIVILYSNALFLRVQVLLANTFCKDAFFKNNYWMTQLQKSEYSTRP